MKSTIVPVMLNLLDATDTGNIKASEPVRMGVSSDPLV